MVIVLDEQPSVANHFLYELRSKDIQKDRSKFRNNLRKLGNVMGYELSKSLNYSRKTVKTPLGTKEIDLVSDDPVVVTILRASLPFAEGVLEYFDQSDVAFIGAYRQEGDEIEIQLDYLAAPEIAGRTLIIIDPMLATGKSLIKAYSQLIQKGSPGHVHFVAAVAAPEGIDYISAHFKGNHTIWTASLDERLNELSYIVPGLGDAGDLSFGAKL